MRSPARLRTPAQNHIWHGHPTPRRTRSALIPKWPLRGRPLTPSVAGALARASRSGLLVDDAAMVEMANYLVETLVKTRHCHAMLEVIIASNDPQSYFGLYSRLWLQSKYGTTAQLFSTLRNAREIWAPHERLGRLAASFIPLFRASAEEKPFKNLLSDTLNSGVRETYKFHMKLAEDLPTFRKMFDALKAPNPSRGTGITHAKFLCLLSSLNNSTAPAAQIATLRTNHSRAFEDTYYRSIGRRLGVQLSR
jgi:hypothetical protein